MLEILNNKLINKRTLYPFMAYLVLYENNLNQLERLFRAKYAEHSNSAAKDYAAEEEENNNCYGLIS